MTDGSSSTEGSGASETSGIPENTSKWGALSWRAISLPALGVVFGDIATSPLYAFRQCFNGHNAITYSPANVLGVVSLIFWSLILVISVKYLVFILRADNRGEGGIIALVALLNPWRALPGSAKYLMMLLGIWGASLLYGDGTITPAISVLSAVEGLEIATPFFQPYVVVITLVILIALFSFQSRGTAGIGAIFGPVVLTWCAVIALLGIASIVWHPSVLVALDPRYGVNFLLTNGFKAFLLLGTVFLAVTGGEALYADMGHFGPKPIRHAWFTIVLPALVLNYFGQAALVLRVPEEIAHPFYHLAPTWALYPLVALATMATVIASQAVITGTFSLTQQAIELGLLPRLTVVHTHGEEAGQIYVPFVNWALMIATLGLVVGFRTSTNLASAYGLAVSMDMVITTILAAFVAYRWGWNLNVVVILALLFLATDLLFLGSNMFKIFQGGWYPLAVAATVFTVMTTWRRGRILLADRLQRNREPLETLLERISKNPPHRVAGTAIFISANSSALPPLLFHHLQHNQVLHERVVLLTIQHQDAPRVPTSDRLEIEELQSGFIKMTLKYGFMQSPNVPVALRLADRVGTPATIGDITYYIGRETIIPSDELPGMTIWREKIFALMLRNASTLSTYYEIPPIQVVELGLQVEI